MTMNVYVGNLANTVTEQELQDLFVSFGEVNSVRIIKDRFTGQSRGFGFVEMSDKQEAQEAIDGINGKEFAGQSLRVNEARPQTQGGPRRDNRRGGGGGGFGGGNRHGGGQGRRY